MPLTSGLPSGPRLGVSRPRFPGMSVAQAGDPAADGVPLGRYSSHVRHLVAIAGPIGAGKSAAAELLGQRLWASGITVSLADLDDVAFSQRAQLELPEFWRRAGIAHSGLVRSWFEAGVDVVIAHGPFFESRSYGSLFGAVPPDAARHHVLLRAPFEIALERVVSDSDRRPTAMSRNPEFLQATHQTFAELERDLPTIDLDIDTSQLTVPEVADRLFEHLQVS